jgi:hypothetical protein
MGSLHSPGQIEHQFARLPSQSRIAGQCEQMRLGHVGKLVPKRERRHDREDNGAAER